MFFAAACDIIFIAFINFGKGSISQRIGENRVEMGEMMDIPRQGKLRLVITDDEESMRLGLSELFPWDELGYCLAGVFRNGWETLRYIEQFGADVLLTDIRMPVMDGLSLLKSLREKGLQTTVVFLSAHSDFEYARQGLAYKVRDYIVKPVQYDEFIAFFRSLHGDLAAGKNPEDTEKGARAAMEKMRHYIETHLKDTSLGNAAATANLSPDYASRIFRKYSGESFADYLHKVKMRRAGELLCRINMRINDVADRLGYDSSQNFSRAFHRYYGVKPSDYRKMSFY